MNNSHHCIVFCVIVHFIFYPFQALGRKGERKKETEKNDNGYDDDEEHFTYTHSPIHNNSNSVEDLYIAFIAIFLSEYFIAILLYIHIATNKLYYLSKQKQCQI